MHFCVYFTYLSINFRWNSDLMVSLIKCCPYRTKNDYNITNYNKIAIVQNYEYAFY